MGGAPSASVTWQANGRMGLGRHVPVERVVSMSARLWRPGRRQLIAHERVMDARARPASANRRQYPLPDLIPPTTTVVQCLQLPQRMHAATDHHDLEAQNTCCPSLTRLCIVGFAFVGADESCTTPRSKAPSPEPKSLSWNPSVGYRACWRQVWRLSRFPLVADFFSAIPVPCRLHPRSFGHVIVSLCRYASIQFCSLVSFCSARPYPRSCPRCQQCPPSTHQRAALEPAQKASRQPIRARCLGRAPESHYCMPAPS